MNTFPIDCRLRQPTTILSTSLAQTLRCQTWWHVDDCTALVLLTQELQELVPVYQSHEGQNDSQGKL